MHRFGPWLDTLVLARHLLPAAPDHTLSAACTALGLLPKLTALCPDRTWHDALYDAFASALLLEHALNLKTAVQATHSRAGAHAHGGKTFSPPSLNG